ncbi:MAG: hypothetical protein J6V38_08450 [Kiritimatiellae bacterium]|nr:hypothetical protein [Kiritimatiellia bacterium]
MKKILKITAWFVGSIFSFLLVLILTHPLWVGSVASCVAESAVTVMAKSDFTIDGLDVNLFTGKVRVQGVALKCPDNAKKNDAVKIQSIDVSFETMSMVSDVQHINEIIIDDLHIYGDVTFSNLRTIADNIEAYLAAHPKDPNEKESKLIIDRVVIKNLKFTYGVMPISIPFDIVITDIGKDSEGASGEDVVDIIVDKVCQAAEGTNKMLGKALRLAIEGGSMVAEGVDAVKDVGGKAVDGIKGMFK